MVWHKKAISATLITVAVIGTIAFTACKVSYSFNGSSIDYNVTKSISFDKFPIRCAYVWSPMEGMFYNALADAYSQKTKLKLLKRNGDLQLSGEITEYSQTNKSVSAEGYSAQTQLKITVNVRFINTKNHSQDFEKQFSATADYDSKLQLTAVQEQLVTEIFKDIIDQIFNATVAIW
ncbi:MAG: LptE family protein [Prevotellaceae bacterium]|nr:LptE family protein [Candidatus Colivivens equi]